MSLQILSLLSKKNRLTIGLVLLWIGICTVSYVFKQSLGISADLLPYLKHFKGLDILISVLIVGILVMQQRGKSAWLLPLTFVSAVGFGSISGIALSDPSLLVLLFATIFGANTFCKIGLKTKTSAIIVAVLAFFLGCAHGHEISASSHLVLYAQIVMALTLLLRYFFIFGVRLAVIIATICVSQLFSAALLTNGPVKAELMSALIDKQAKKSIGRLQTSIELNQSNCQSMPTDNGYRKSISFTANEREVSIFQPKPSASDSSTLAIGIQFLSSGVGLTSPPSTWFDLFYCLSVFFVTSFFCYVFYPGQQRIYSLYSAVCIPSAFQCFFFCPLRSVNAFRVGHIGCKSSNFHAKHLSIFFRRALFCVFFLNSFLLQNLL